MGSGQFFTGQDLVWGGGLLTPTYNSTRAPSSGGSLICGSFFGGDLMVILGYARKALIPVFLAQKQRGTLSFPRLLLGLDPLASGSPKRAHNSEQ